LIEATNIRIRERILDELQPDDACASQSARVAMGVVYYGVQVWNYIEDLLWPKSRTQQYARRKFVDISVASKLRQHPSPPDNTYAADNYCEDSR